MADSSNELRIELLGPVEARVDGRAVALGGQRPRALFAALALMPGHVVSVDQLIDEVWGDEPPARARDSLQMHVSRLRKGLAGAGADGGRLVSHAGGYSLEVHPGERDVDHWHQALDRARRARSDGEPRVAREELAAALGVWRGHSLAGVTANSLLAAEGARLEEERLAAIVEGIELDLELGRHGELPGQFEALVLAHPFREHLVELQMLALYRCGRQADALAAFQAARGRLVDQLGIEPAQPLCEVHERVLSHSTELFLPAETPLEAQPRPAQPGAPTRCPLPVPPNRTIGRDQDVLAVSERLRAASVRLITLIGPGGVGKTRLAIEVARAVQADFADGAHFVSLAALHRHDDVPAAIVKALRIVVLAGESDDQAAARFLAAKHLLLITDNLEHVLAAGPFLAGLLERGPSLTVLATSREPLALQAEERHRVSPLAVPDPGAADRNGAPAGADAVTLFCERARAHDPDVDLGDANAAAVLEICRRTDGLPLAIELAAARCGLLSPPEIADRLDAALGAPGAGARDAPARQQTLRATIDWSHDLLGDAEKRCFARFAVFAGGATVEAAETITAGALDTLDGLVAKSLLVRRPHALAPARLEMLETIRAYAAERLSSAVDAEVTREEHFGFYLALAQRHGTERALRGAGAREHLARLDAEIDNLHAAFAWAVARANAERALAMAAALGGYWLMRHRYADAVTWVDQALDLPGADAHPAQRVRALCTKSRCLWQLGRGVEQSAIVAAAEATARRLGDPVILSQALQQRVDHEIDLERLEIADAVATEALHWARAAGDDWEIAAASRGKAIAAPSVSELRDRVDEAASLLGEAGNVSHLANLLTSAAYAALCLGSEHDATDFAARAMPIASALDTGFELMINSGNLGLAALLTGETEAAAAAFRQELRLCRETVARPVLFEGLRGLAAVAVADGDDKRAATLLGAADAHRHDVPQDRVEARLDEVFFVPARTRYETEGWNAAACHGGALSFEESIAYALEEPR